MTGFGRFWVPGPSEVRPEVLDALRAPMRSHRSPEIAALFERIQPGLQEAFATSRPVFVLTSSGTGAVEAGLRAVPRGRVLSLVNGAFSERFATMAAACGHEVDRLEVEWGRVHDPDAVAERARDRGYAAITVVHSETSTGALQPLAALAAATSPTPLLVDAVSSAFGTRLGFDEHRLDYVATASQKALALPPGLAFAVASPRLLERARDAQGRGLYLDLLAYERRQPPFTPALPLVHALAVQLRAIAEEGFDGRCGRHRAMAARTWQWVGARPGLSVLAPEHARSPTVTCIRLPEGLRGPDVVQAVAERGYVLGSGYGPLRETTFRIGHMGDQTVGTLEGLLAACDGALDALSRRARG